MTPELKGLLIDWKVKGFVDCRAEWEAIENYLNQQEANKQTVCAKLGKARLMILEAIGDLNDLPF